MFYSDQLDTPIGRLQWLADEDGALVEVVLPVARTKVSQAVRHDPQRLARIRKQFTEYFEGRRFDFELPLHAQGTLFQQQVWTALRSIGYGQTASYGELARCIGRPRSVRAVGAANGANPLPIVVPCHRVIGADGSLTGYAGGLAAKRWLLAHERAHDPRRGRQ